MSDTDPMTPAQREALDKAWNILAEHFERVLLVIDWDVETGEDRNSRVNAHECLWHGGSLSAIGLAVFAHDRILHGGERYNTGEE